MARYAVVRDSDDVITNIASWDGVSSWSPGAGFTAIADPTGVAEVGGTYIAPDFFPAEPPEDPVPETHGDDRATTGTATLDFGLTPSDAASVFVPLQLDIVLVSKVTASFQVDTMGIGEEHNGLEDHLLAAENITLTSGVPVTADGFWIYAQSSLGLWTGKFRIRWTWSQ